MGACEEVHNDDTFNFTSVLGNQREKKVSPSTIVNTKPMVLSAQRCRDDKLERASILEPQHQPVSQHYGDSARSTVEQCGPRGVAAVFIQSRKRNQFLDTQNPLIKFLADGNKDGA